MRITKRQLRNTIRKVLRESNGIDDYEKLVGSRRSQMSAPSSDTQQSGSPALDHLINCYLNGMSDEECADSMPNASDSAGLQDFANFVMRVVNTYKQQANF